MFSCTVLLLFGTIYATSAQTTTTAPVVCQPTPQNANYRYCCNFTNSGHPTTPFLFPTTLRPNSNNNNNRPPPTTAPPPPPRGGLTTTIFQRINPTTTGVISRQGTTNRAQGATTRPPIFGGPLTDDQIKQNFQNVLNEMNEWFAKIPDGCYPMPVRNHVKRYCCT